MRALAEGHPRRRSARSPRRSPDQLNGGETVVPTSDQAPTGAEPCYVPAGTTTCGRSPATRSGPSGSPTRPSTCSRRNGDPASGRSLREEAGHRRRARRCVQPTLIRAKTCPDGRRWSNLRVTLSDRRSCLDRQATRRTWPRGHVQSHVGLSANHHRTRRRSDGRATGNRLVRRQYAPLSRLDSPARTDPRSPGLPRHLAAQRLHLLRARARLRPGTALPTPASDLRLLPIDASALDDWFGLDANVAPKAACRAGRGGTAHEVLWADRMIALADRPPAAGRRQREPDRAPHADGLHDEQNRHVGGARPEEAQDPVNKNAAAEGPARRAARRGLDVELGLDRSGRANPQLSRSRRDTTLREVLMQLGRKLAEGSRRGPRGRGGRARCRSPSPRVEPRVEV